MRGQDSRSGSLFSYIDLEQRVRSDHPLRTIRTLVNEALASLDGRFGEIYSEIGRPSIPPEQLLRAMMLSAHWKGPLQARGKSMKVFPAILCIATLLASSSPLLAKLRSDRAAMRAEAEHVCYGDAQTLCPDAIPDEAKVKACMKAKHNQLSPACMKIFDRGI